MKRRLKEETVIFISVVKWLFLASVIGVIVGVSTTIFVKSLNWASQISAYPYYFLALPIGLLLSALIVKYILPEAEGQ